MEQEIADQLSKEIMIGSLFIGGIIGAGFIYLSWRISLLYEAMVAMVKLIKGQKEDE